MAGQRVDLQTAAELLDISSDAVRKRAKRGTIPYETGVDGKLYVWVDEASPGETDDYPGEHGQTDYRTTPGHDRTGDQTELVESLLEQLAYMREQLAEEREARRRADTIMAQLAQANAEQARAIQALEPGTLRDEPRGPETVTDEPGSTSASEAAPEPETASSQGAAPERRASWWRRFFGFE